MIIHHDINFELLQSVYSVKNIEAIHINKVCFDDLGLLLIIHSH